MGAKTKTAHQYGKPKFDKIIEPFAGSARYALLHWEYDVDLYDTSKYVYEVWKYLLEASPADILSLPDVPSKVDLNTIAGLTTAERYLIGFHLCRGKAVPRRTGHGQNSWSRDRERIAYNLFKIKHWKISDKSYQEIPNEKATWFFDPPYQKVQERPGNSDRYPEGKLDYNELAKFILSRQGFSIACEGTGADYLPFEVLAITNTNTNNRITKKNLEWIYTQNSEEL